MTVDALVTPLLRVQLFKDLQPIHLAKIARVAERIIYKPGDLIIREGGAGDAAFLVVSGETVRIEGPGDTEAEEMLPAHALIGEMAMLVETEHSSTVIAKSQVKALRIPREGMLELMEQDPSLAEHFIAKLTGRLHHLAEELRMIDYTLRDEAGVAVGSRALVPAGQYEAALH